MNQNFFWNTWPQAYKRVFYFLSLLTMLALMLSWFWYFKGNDNVISWLTGQSVKTFSMPVYAFQLGPFQIETDSDFYVIIERIFASDLIPQTLPLYFFLVVLGIALIVLLSIISTLSRYWYLLGMAVFILFVVSLGLPQLRLLGRIDNLPVAAMLLVFLLPSYYLHSFKKDASFNARLLVFTLLTGVVAFFVYLFAGVQSPLLQLAAYAQTVPLIISILFIFIVSHEIPASFISVLSNNAFKGKAAHQFLFIAALYLLNLVVTYLQYIYIIDWNFIFINLLLLFSISALLGLWGFKNREPQYENILPFKPLGAFLFLALALISFGFLAQAYGNANDPYIKVIRDAILYSHLGYGIIFVTYVASNFLSMLSNNLPVNKVLYKPNRMPYFTFNLAGLIATLAFVFVNNWKVPYFNSYAGYYNSIADVHNILGEDEAAEGYYRMANTQSFGVDHHSNFVIAGIERNKYERIKERVHLERANQLRPSEYAYVDLGNNLYKSGMADDAIRLYLKAYQLYPDVGAISNNLALSFYERQAYDSAFYLFARASNHKSSREEAGANMFAYAALDDLDLDADSLISKYPVQAYAAQANKIALLKRQLLPDDTDVKLIFKDTLLTGAHVAFISNYVNANLFAFDSTAINQLESLARKPVNADYAELLLFNTAQLCYYNGQVARALNLVGELAYTNFDNSGKYNYHSGLWMLEQGNIQKAIVNFEQALFFENEKAAYPLAVAYTEAGRNEEALAAWEALASLDDIYQPIASALKNVLQTDLPDVQILTDAEKYQYLRYRINYLDTANYFQVLRGIKTPEYEAQALLDLSKKYFEADDLRTAIRVFSRISGLPLRDAALYDRIQIHELHMLAVQGDLSSLRENLNPALMSKLSWLEQLYFNSILMESDGELAARNFNILGAYNPFFDEAILAAATYYPEHAYRILVDAVLLNPQSVKITKAYILAAVRSGYRMFAAEALERLRDMIPASAYHSFIVENEALLTEEDDF